MNKICLVSCVSAKMPDRAPARDLYLSPLFQKARAYATSRFDGWRILSAKYGLLLPDQIVDPYDQTLKRTPKEARLAWADHVFKSIYSSVPTDAILAFVAGEYYRETLLPKLNQQGYTTRVPLEGLSIGLQLSWLRKLEEEQQRLRHLDQFYSLLKRLEHGCGGKRVLRECTDQLDWPRTGVSFFFEPYEYRSTAVDQSRVVRVDTHSDGKGANYAFRRRLNTHTGAFVSDNHRQSRFRFHVGTALMNRSPHRSRVLTWGNDQNSTREVMAAEAELETEVSDFIGAMSLVWLATGEQANSTSDRAYIARNATALLAGSTGPLDLPTRHWLGRLSDQGIRQSGLWNRSCGEEHYDPRFLETMAVYVDVTTGQAPSPKGPIAPSDWPDTKRKSLRAAQMDLFNAE